MQRPPQDSSRSTDVTGNDMPPQPTPSSHAESAESESRDVIMDLPNTSTLGKGKRSRSETESRSTKVNLLPFKGRKRSQTFQEGGVVKEKEDPEDVNQ